MKKNLFFLLILLIGSATFAQDFQWAYTAGLPTRSHTVAVRQSNNRNYCLAVYTDSSSFRSSSLFMYNVAQQLLWTKSFIGNVTLQDVETCSDNSLIAVGSFEDSVLIGNTWLYSSPGYEGGFIFKCDENGNFLWAKTLNPFNDSFEPANLYLANDSLMYLTARLNGASASFCSFHQLNEVGVITKSEMGGNFDNRTYTNILTDANGNICISGTCGSSAVFDSLHADINFSYQNFLVKYDSSFNAIWLICKQYITFDDNNKLTYDGSNLYWAYNDFSSLNGDTVRVLKLDVNGQTISSFDGQVQGAFFPGIAFDMDAKGNGVLIEEAFVRLYITRIDSSFNVVWRDTIYTGASGFAQEIGLSCYDSCFYLSSLYYSDTLTFGNINIVNPNVSQNSPSDLFVSKWGYPTITSVQINANTEKIELFPNPVNDYLQVMLNEEHDSFDISIFDVNGKTIALLPNSNSNRVDVSCLSPGLYLLNLKYNNRNYTTRFVKL
jgi:Secretion system C-terminal sorting domain